MIVTLLLILTIFSYGVLSFDPLWPYYEYHYFSPGLRRFERGPPAWARGHGNKNGNGPPGHNKHGHGPPDFAPGHNRGHGQHKPDEGSSEEFVDHGDNHKLTSTQRPPTPLPTIAIPQSTSTDYTGLIDIRFKPVEDRNKRSKGTDPSTEIQDLQNTQTQDIQERNALGFWPWHHDPPNAEFKSYYPFYPPRLSTCVKKFDCIPMYECKNPPRKDFEFAFCKWVDDEPYVCCEKTRAKPQNILKCGRKKTEFSQALIGGTPVEEGTAYPWMVAIGESKENESVDWYCGGALIGERTVITAAHCVSRRNANIIRIGEIDLSIDVNNETESNMQQISVCRTLIHPLYRSPLLYNDIALLYLEDSVEVSPYASPICLPQKFSITDTPVALLTGWGQLSFATDRSDKLQEVTLKVFNNSYCDEQYALTQASKRFFPRGILDSQLCAGDETGGKDACQGDSGAPLVANQDGNFVLIGTVSAGIGCGSQTFPGVYTRISSFAPWIFDNII